MKKCVYFSGLVATFGLCTLIYTSTSVAAKPETDIDKFSYAIGYQIGQGMKRDNLDINVDVVAEAIRDVMGDKPLQMEFVDMSSAVTAMQQKMQAKQAAAGEQAKSAGMAYLEANKDKEGVTTLPSGVQYKVIKSGEGKQPSATDTITAHYQGSFINGNVFDSSYQRGQPATFPVNQVIKGWQEILPLMHEGDKWQVVIPSDLAYGPNGSNNRIGPNETLVFDIELISVN